MSGQTMVEFSLVLPVFCFVIFVLIQAFVYAYNTVEHQRMAQISGDHLSRDSYKSKGFYHWFHGLRGSQFPTQIRRRLMPLPANRNFRGFETTDGQAYLVRSELITRNFPLRFMGRWLFPATSHAFVETYLEPALPKEGAQ